MLTHLLPMGGAIRRRSEGQRVHNTVPPGAPSGQRESQEPEAKHRRRSGLLARLRAYLFAGILVTAPISITIYLSLLIINGIDATVAGLIPARYNPETYLPFSVPGIGLLMVLGFLILVGMFAAGLVGRLLVRIGEGVVGRMPIVRSVYSTTKQIFETVLANQSDAFREVVLVEYPRRGMWCIGFITGTTEGEVQNLTADDVVNVFLPTTPNPTSGFLLFVPREDLVKLTMSVEDGIKMVMSGGIVTPPDRRPSDQRDRKLIPPVEHARLPEEVPHPTDVPPVRPRQPDDRAAE